MKLNSAWWPATADKLREMYYASTSVGRPVPPLFVVRASIHNTCTVSSYRVLYIPENKLLAKSLVFSPSMVGLDLVRESTEDMSMALSMHFQNMEELVSMNGILILRGKVYIDNGDTRDEELACRLLKNVDPLGKAYLNLFSPDHTTFPVKPSAVRFRREDMALVLERMERAEWTSSGN